MTEHRLPDRRGARRPAAAPGRAPPGARRRGRPGPCRARRRRRRRRSRRRRRTARAGPRRPAGRPRPAAAPACATSLGAVAAAVGAAFGRRRDAPPRLGRPTPPSATGRPARCSATCWPRPRRGCPSATPTGCARAHPGASDDEIADALVARAGPAHRRASARPPAGSSAAHWFAPASLLAVPLELGAETVLIAAVEVVLIGELHELHGRRAARRRRGRALPPTWRAGRPSGRSTAAAGGWARCSAPPGCARCAGASPGGWPGACRPRRRSCSAPRWPAGATGGRPRRWPSGCCADLRAAA